MIRGMRCNHLGKRFNLTLTAAMEILRKKMAEIVTKERPWEKFILSGKRPIPELQYYDK
jgi:hypothetical protein